MRTIALITGVLLILTMSTIAFAARLRDRLEALEERVSAVEELTGKVEQLQSDVGTLQDQAATKDDMRTLEARINAIHNRVTALEQIPYPRIVDANGQILGAFGGVGPNGAGVLMDIDGILTSLAISSTAIVKSCGLTLYFETTDCTGSAFIKTSQAPPALQGFLGNSWICDHTLYIQRPGPSQTFTAKSLINYNLSARVCQLSVSPDDYVETVAHPRSILDVFVPPFTITGVPGRP